MNDLMHMTQQDKAWLSEIADAPERARVETWREILARFQQADNRGEIVDVLVAEYGERVRISQPTIYTKLALVKKEGWPGLLRKRWRARYLSETNSADEFEEFLVRLWHPLCEELRKTAAAARVLFLDHLCAGRIIPGYDTDWRGIYRFDHRKSNMSPPDRCPYELGRCWPHGWSMRHLTRLAPDRYELTAARIGMGAARSLLPSIPTSRVHLPFARVVIIDDMFHDAHVRLLGNRLPRGVVEMRAHELKTATRYAWGAKPVRERDDGTKEHLREAFTRYLMAEILCNKGYHPDGLLVVGERGTAKLPADLVTTCNKWAGEDKVRFEAGGVVDIPLARGLYGGAGRGNFRFKAALESTWNLVKNDLSALPGGKGADPEHAPEDLARRERHDKQLMTICHALVKERPDLVEHLRGMFPPYHQYIEAVQLVYDRIEDRHDHHLEGFDECGFVQPVWRLHTGDAWKPESLLDEMDPQVAEHLRQIIRSDPGKFSDMQVMSPRQAAEKCRETCELVRLPQVAVPEILGPELGDVEDVHDDETLYIKDKYIPGRRYPVAALVRTLDGRKQVLPRGSKWLIHINPFSGRVAYVSTPDQRFVGIAPVLVAGSRLDREVLLDNLKIFSSVKAREVRRLTPLVDQRLQTLVENAEHDVTLISGSNPVHDAQEQAEHDAATAERARHTQGSITELVPRKHNTQEDTADDETDAEAAGAPIAPAAGLSELFTQTHPGDQA